MTSLKTAVRTVTLLGLGMALGGCAFPNKENVALPNPGIITVTQDASGFRAVPPDCTPLLEASRLDKPEDRRPAIAFGCATYTNLANQVARPNDLTHPKPYAGQSADTAAGAAQRYREGQVTELRGTSTTDVGVTSN